MAYSSDQEFADAAWAFATVAKAAERQIGDFDLHQIALSAWALLTKGDGVISDASLFSAVASAVTRRMGGFTTQSLTNPNIVWALAKLSIQ